MRASFAVIAVALALLASTSTAAQTLATTEDGRQVILKPDGTWEYAPPQSQGADQQAPFDFRKVRWGMSKSQVEASEPNKPDSDDESSVAYNTTVSGIQALTVYSFIDNKLVNAGYSFIPKHTNENDYISDFDSIKRALVEKYGAPASDRSTWRDDLYKDEYSKWGFAVSLGHLVYMTDWETDRTMITLLLSGENYEISLNLFYRSKELAYLTDKQQQQKRKSEF